MRRTISDPGGAFLSRMEARDGSEGFDFSGRFLSFESLREIVDGKEVTGDEKASPWRGALENYSLKPVGSKTLLSVDTDIPAELFQLHVKINRVTAVGVKERLEDDTVNGEVQLRRIT